MTGILVEFSDGRPSLTSAEEATAALAPIGAGIWPIDFRDAPADLMELLGRSALSDAESARVRDHFLMPREQLLEVLAGAGREPRVPGGGALETFAVLSDRRRRR